MKVVEEALYEHDPFVDMNPELQAELERRGFKHVDTEDYDECGRPTGTIDVWYHPKHWSVLEAFTPATVSDGPGDAWFDDWKFVALTPEAKRWNEEN